MQRPKRLAVCLLVAVATLATGGCALLAPPADPAKKDDVGTETAAPAQGEDSDNDAAASEGGGADAVGVADSSDSDPDNSEAPAAQAEQIATSEQPAQQDDEATAEDGDAASGDEVGAASTRETATSEEDTAASAAVEEKSDEQPPEVADKERTAEGKDSKDDETGPKLELAVSWVSNYVFRGVSLSNGLPALQGSLDYSFPLIWGLSGNVGLWRSQVRFDAEVEFSADETPDPVPIVGVRRESGIYGGVSGDLVAGWTWSAQLYSYRYPGFKQLDYLEKSITLTRAFAELPGQPQVDIARATFRSVFFPGADGKYIEFNLKLALIGDFTVAAHFGSSRFADQELGGRDYVDRSITLSRSFGEYLFELAATNTNTNQFGRLGEPSLLLRASRTF